MSSFALRLGAAAATATLGCTALAATGTAAAPTGPPAAPSRPGQPNIVFVLADDLGWADVSTGRTNKGSGSGYHATRTVDRLAAEGIAFDNAYGGPNCVPTRAALLTGLYAPRPTNNLYLVGDLDRGGDDTLLDGPPQGLPDGDDALPGEAYTVGEALRDAGYATGYVGKFHVTRTAEQITTDFGFEENLGGSNSGHASQYHAIDGNFNNSVAPALDRFAADYTQQYVDQNIKPHSHGVAEPTLDALVGTDKHVTDAVTDATIDFIDRHKQQPFFTWLSNYAVHTPIGDKQARADLLTKYQAKPAVPGHPADASYAALLEGLDQGLARIVAHLETTPDPRNPGHPLADNTIVVFTSDNGGTPNADNGWLSGYKGELREGGLRVPAVVWSGNERLVDGGVIDSTPIHAVDYLPTFARLAGADLPRGLRPDGVDLSGIWRNRNAEQGARPLFWHLPGYLVSGVRNQHPETMIRSGPWKLSYDYETRDWDLYHLDSDIGETTDLATTYPNVTRRLGDRLLRWLDDVDAPLATLRAGKAPITVTFQGTAYADGKLTRYGAPTRLTFQPGDEVPALLPTAAALR
ncbi:sulfatase-like hydrolase/transferase [Micromonospora sp. NPDC047074]|uniref:sulfatase-like hydrolase/transferase n=1 Tax=Micromonospora sp. NPDC047074 TaxID=3154339 RepID=UPI003407D7E4